MIKVRITLDGRGGGKLDLTPAREMGAALRKLAEVLAVTYGRSVETVAASLRAALNGYEYHPEPRPVVPCAADALMQLSESVRAVYDRVYEGDDLSYCGLGCVFRAIGCFFDKRKKQALTWYVVLVRAGYFRPEYRRRTAKATKAPMPRQGWKGGR